MKVLFVCEGNVNRSQMAAAFLHERAPEIEVRTAGTLTPPQHEEKAVAVVTPNSVAAMKEKGIDISEARMHRLTKEMVDEADLVILVGPTLGGPLPDFLVKRDGLREWGVPDPGYGVIPFEEARDLIEAKVEALAGELAS